MPSFAARALVVLIALFAIGTSPSAARADAVGGVEGVARISYLHGDVDIVRADAGNTVAAALNAPLAVGDTLVTHTNARAELELDFGTLVRVAPESQVRFSRIDSTDHRLQLALGSVELRVFRKRGQNASVETPQVTLRPSSPGRFRATVASNGDADLGARSGSADVTSESGSRALTSGESLAATGTFAAPALHDVVSYDADDFDRWTDSRDEQIVRAREGAYLDRDLVGIEDLDANGRWIDDPRYGRVWSPYETAGWAPYHDGRFVWEPYYGWTWVAAEPWGWAPYHYGNWFYGANGWCWYPGSAFAPAYVYRPAVVAFFSFGSGFDFGFGNIGWVPLAPYEPYHPWYGRNVTVVNNITNVTNVTNVYNAPPPATSGNLNYTIYHNANAPGGFVSVQSKDFANGRFAHVDNVKPIALSHATVVRGVVPIVPTTQNLAPTSKAPGAPSATLPNATFARFAPPTTRVRPFDLERTDVRAAARVVYPTAHVVYPTAPTTTTVVPHPNTLTSQQATDAIPRSIGATRATDHTTRTPIVTILSNGPTVASPRVLSAPPAVDAAVRRAASPWDRFGGRTPTAIVGHPETTLRDATVRPEAGLTTVPVTTTTGSDAGRPRVQILRGDAVRGDVRGANPSAPTRSIQANENVRATGAAARAGAGTGASASTNRSPVEHEPHVTHGTIVEHESARTQ